MQIEWAARRGDISAIERQLQRGVTRDALDGALMAAATGAKADLATLQLLIDRGANVNVVGGSLERTPLMLAASAGNPAKVRFLLAAGADPRFVNRSNYSTITALPTANDDGHNEILEILLQAGADPNITSRFRECPLYNAVTHGNCQAIRLLLEYGANREFISVNPVLWALALGSVQDVAAELASETGYCDRDAWFLAVMIGDVAKADLLLANGANLDDRGKYDRTSLMHAVMQDHTEMARWLLAQGADVHSDCMFQQTALSLAASSGSVDCVRILLDAGAPIDRRRYPVLPFANNVEVVQLLVGAGADMNEVSSGGHWVLNGAAEEGDATFSRQLLELGADPNTSHLGRTALHAAVAEDHLEIVSLLLQHGADVNAADLDGYTPLSNVKSLECLELLLAAGADTYVRNLFGREIVQYHRDPQLIERLLIAGATFGNS